VKDNNIIKSFFSKDNLNSKIWDENMQLRTEVREKLLQTANEFIDFIDNLITWAKDFLGITLPSPEEQQTINY